MVEVEFCVRKDGRVDAKLVGEWPIFNDALEDSISSVPPIGADGSGASTYWIDVAHRGVQRAREQEREAPFTWGNYTELSLVGETVIARYDYADEEEPADELAMIEFITVLEQWRERVVESARAARSPLPMSGRRNPMA